VRKISGRFGNKRKHGRGRPKDDRTGSEPSTVEIPHGRNPKNAPLDPTGWDSLAEDQLAIDHDERDVQTVQVKPPPVSKARQPALPHDGPSPRSENDTVLASVQSVVKGKVAAVLLGIEGPLDGHVIRVFDGDNLIGREGQPDPIPDTHEARTISKRHARLSAGGGYFLIEPVAEKNATFVNEKRIETREVIQNGDRLRLGSARPTTFVLLVP
jgi:hypothetical protein